MDLIWKGICWSNEKYFVKKPQITSGWVKQDISWQGGNFYYYIARGASIRLIWK